MNRFLYILFLLIFPISVLATHNRAGEITYEHISNFKYKATIVTYTKTSSPPDRMELPFNWNTYGPAGGSPDTLPRISKVDIGGDVTINTYEGTHIYNGLGTFVMSFEDPNRNGGVVNMMNSVNIPFYVETTLIISPFLGFNNSVQLLEPPIDNGCFNKLYIHNPNAFDPDGDSLSYELVSCKGQNGIDIPSWSLPTASDSIWIDSLTGDFIWDTPALVGEFNIAILIKEYRNGQLIGSVMRDMQITIIPCNNNAPQINPINDICVDAGDTINFTVNASDIDNEQLTLTSTGGPYLITNPATFPQPQVGTGNVSGNFTWFTKCNHVRKLPYQVIFKVTDNNPDVNLIDIERVNITVIGPAPKNPVINLIGNNVNLSWNQSECSEAVSYEIYRRQGFYGFIPGPCETGVPAYTGYQLIGTTNSLTDTTFSDDNGGAGLIPGNEYCYMVVAIYPDGAKSYASVEVCTELNRTAPIITNVSITSTDAATGTTYIAWSKPSDIDTIQAPGPYHYELKRSDGFFGSNLVNIAIINDLNDTIFNDTGLNTEDGPWSYQVDIWNDTPGNTFLLGSSLVASSIFLTISPTDQKNTLSWEEHVPWTNNEYIVYRQNPSLVWDSIGVSSTQSYTDINLVNGTEYCYYIESIGEYSGSGFINPIENLSQEKCATPIDNVPPCPPDLNSSTDCLSANFLNWDPYPNVDCNDDIEFYSIYYTPELNGIYSLLATINDANDTTYIHSGLQASVAGCYYITATDSIGNESLASDTTCIENCPLFDLPNVFTPNNDNLNDLFIPLIPSPRFIESIELFIYNRWGQIVFETTDPYINWDGKHKDSGKILSDGVYQYTCKVNEIFLSGIKPRTLTGFVHIIDANSFSE